MATLRRCQARPTEQLCSMPQWPVPDGAFGEREGPFQRVEDRGGADVFRVARQLVAAMRAARGIHQPRALQLLEQLADRGRRDVRALGQAAGVLQARPVRGQGGQDDRRVVRELCRSEASCGTPGLFSGPF